MTRPFAAPIWLVLFSSIAFGAIGIDANTSMDRTSASTISTPAFSTNTGNELLLAFVASDYKSSANTTVKSIAGAGLTWVLAVRTNGQRGTPASSSVVINGADQAGIDSQRSGKHQHHCGWKMAITLSR